MEGKRPRVCKICSRKFANGKAMGGHMRSHFVKLSLPPKITVPLSPSPPPFEDISTITSPSSHQSPDRNQLVKENYCFRYLTSKRGKRRSKLLDTVLFDGESRSDSVSSFPDEVLTVEEAAICLIRLSRDKEVAINNMNINVDIDVFDHSYVGEWVRDIGEQENDDDAEWECVNKHTGKSRVKYKCESCNKLFKSHQALGGHRAATHKNKQIIMEKLGVETADKIKEVRVFACPFCNKVFPSGQALGGHKKIHFTYLTVMEDKSSAVKVSDDTSSASAHQLLDLNLTPPDCGN